MDIRLYDALKNLSREDILPMHTPGHKRNLAEFDWLGELGGAFDITETEGFDNLHDAHGMIADICTRAAKLWGSRRAFLSVNGSTGAVLAAICACVKRNDRILVARNCHKSVFNAAELAGAEMDFVYPAQADCFGIAGNISPDDVSAALEKGGYAAVVLTSPTYDGVVSDVAAIAEAAHKAGAVLIADEAHGAHFGLFEHFPESSIRLGADVVISGVHKSLPALTQTAFLHLCSERVDEARVGKYFSCFVTSSPSYVLMASVDKMLGYLEDKGARRFAEFASALDGFYAEVAGLKCLRVLPTECGNINGIYEKDASKIYIDCKNCRFDGYGLKKTLRSEFGIEVEYATPAGVLCLASAGDDAGTLKRLSDALSAVDKDAERTSAAPAVVRTASFPVCPKACSANEISERAAKRVPFKEAAGRIAAESVGVYPPCIPVLLCGERVTRECVDYLATVRAAGAEIISDSGDCDSVLVAD